MDLLIYLDIPLIVVGLLTMSPWLWSVLLGRQSLCLPLLGRGTATATAVLFYLGLGTLLVAGMDVGLAQWDQACRAKGGGIELQESMLAPDFALPSLDENRTFRLSDYRGQKPVVLVFGNFY